MLAWSQPTLVVPPRPLPGPYAVACSNVAQDFSRMAPGEDVQTYWEGVPRDDGSARYITDLLAEPANTLSAAVNVPDNSDVYGSFAGHSITYVIIACYPTGSDNARPDYPLPNGHSVPHMQRGTQQPSLPDSTSRFPLLVFSEGYLGSPTSNDYIQALAVLASNGYVVAAPFDGDGRFAKLQLENFNDFVYVVSHIRDFIGLQALRPLSLSATLDVLLARPEWRDRIDASQIGGFGASLGGEALLLMAGGGLTTSLGLSWTKITHDTRLKAAVGYVPYFGQPIFPAFGRDDHGLDDVTLPYLAISGTADTTAPISETTRGMGRLSGPRALVALNGVQHGFDVASTNDIFTWTLNFLDAEVRGSPGFQTLLAQTASVAGGGDDHVVVPLQATPSNNYGGLWWNAPPGSESGWGINLVHQGDTIFATWFTYDLTGKAWWLSMTAERVADGNYRGTLFESNGPPYFAVPFDPSAVMRRSVGNAALTFTDRDNGTFSYTVNGVSDTKMITLQAFGPLPTCVFGSPTSAALATNYQDLWWKQPAGSESGWGLNLTQQGDVIFAAWFTYDAAGAPTWLSATLRATQPGMYGGVWYRTSGPAFTTHPFDPARVARIAVGTANLTFGSGDIGTFAYTVDGITQSKAITRELLHAPGTVCAQP